jgi:hypothetical protein
MSKTDIQGYPAQLPLPTLPSTLYRLGVEIRSAIYSGTALVISWARGWPANGAIHSPKNLAMAIGVEAGELMDHFRWHSEAESIRIMEKGEIRQAAGEELARCGDLRVIVCESRRD